MELIVEKEKGVYNGEYRHQKRIHNHPLQSLQ